ncbi:tryptophan-rich sensory protein [Pseudidiomarina sediminum]|uniref:Tryptophan-rich sensory protein n=1 Tax=Pseudidiomarina sediminum TaxID=431675 RepID=A0A432Z4E7_9GAMM|nr:TspO/MBR family protein [Pseudidiomarina sediminum]RUO72689.1 tryptophan-rich sensory protein [Pseudidiomarina sediminum]
MSVMKQFLGLIAWLLVSFIVAAIGGLGSVNAPVFYQELQLPSWAPPTWLFGPVWTALYTMMAVAAWLVWRQHGFAGKAKIALSINIVQLLLNTLWSWLFFAWYLGALSFIEIVLLWFAIAATVVAYWRLNKAAALLLVPYWLWVTFAAGLSYSIWQLNPGVL